jgi:excisionase family DNA binding protein
MEERNVRRSRAVPQEETPIRGAQLLNVKHVAKKLDVSLRTVYNMAEDGTLTTCKIRGCIRFDAIEVENYILLSKFRRDDYQFDFTANDIQDLFDRMSFQIEQTKLGLEKLIADKNQLIADKTNRQRDKEAGMKK